MLRNTSLILCLAVVVLTVGCTNAPAPPPPDTRAADVQAVKDVEAAWLKEMSAKDADKFASYLAEDCSGLTAVRLKVEENQLVGIFGEIGVLVDGLKGA